MDSLNDLGPLGIGVVMIAIGVIILKSKLSSTFWKVLQWLLIIGGILLVVNETIGFENIGSAIAFALTWLGRFFAAVGEALQIAGAAMDRLGE